MPEAGDDVVFTGTTAKTGGTISLAGTTTAALSSLTFGDLNSGNWTLANGTLTVSPESTVFTNSKSALSKISCTIAGSGDLVKRGEGTLSFSGTNTFTGRLILEDGRFQPEVDEAFGVAPATLRADAIVLKGGILGSTETYYAETIIGPTRGITIENGAGEIGVRSSGTLRIQSPIAGTGDLRISRQSGTVCFEAPCSYTGQTILAYAGEYYSGNSCSLEFAGAGALPSTTTLSALSGTSSILTSTVELNGTTQCIAAVETGSSTHLILQSAAAAGGVLRFGTADDTAVSVSNLYVSAGATLAYAGAGTLTPGPSIPAVTVAEGTTFALESGTLSLVKGALSGTNTWALGTGTTVVLADDMTDLAGDIVLNGSATLSAASSTLALTGNLISQAADAVLTVSGAATTFGAPDSVLRTFGASISGSSVTLDGWIDAAVDPAAYAKTENCVIFGTYSGVATGDLALDGQTRGILSVAELGDGTESISLANGSRLVIVAEENLSASYSVTLDATSTLELGGAGRIDLSAASLSGSGTVKLSGGTVRLPASVDGGLSFAGPGTVEVPEGETQTLVWTGGQLEKTGAGTLVLTGASDATMSQLTVSAGTVRLGFTNGAKMRGHVAIAEGATLVLDGDEQINDYYNVIVNGTFDLNGHTERIYSYNNIQPKNTLRTTSAAAIVNRSTEKATLAVSGESAFLGRISEEPGQIEIVGTSGLVDPVGLEGSVAPSLITIKETGTLFPYTRWGTVRFVFHTTMGNAATVQLSEIQLTYHGKPIPLSAISGSSSSGADSSHPAPNLYDNRADTYWQSTVAQEVTVDLGISGYYPIDGYRLAANTVGNAPLDWDVYVHRADPTGYLLVDSRRGERIVRADPSWSTFDRMMSSNYYFSAASRPRSPLASTTAVKLDGTYATAMRVSSTDPMVIGSLSGTGGIRMEDGSTLAPANVTDWTGRAYFQNCTNYQKRATLCLSSERGGPAEQPVHNLTATNANISIENGGTRPVSVLVDDSVQQPLRGRLADGKGPLGLVKRGSGDFVLGTADCANTGLTSIEEGCLKVCGIFGAGRPVAARYLRIHPTKNNGGYDSNGFNWGMNEFQLLDAEGNLIEFPEGTTVSAENGFHSSQTGARLIDGNIDTRCLVANLSTEKTTQTGYCPWVVIDMKSSVSFSGYRWYTPHNNAADQNRVPVQWTLEISDDGSTWSSVDVAEDSYTADYGSGNTGFLRGPYALRGESDGISSLATIPSEFFAETTGRTTRAMALKARYFKFQPHETYNPTYSSVSYGWMLSEFSLFKDGERVDWPEGTTPRLVGGGLNTSNGSSLANICDNEITGSTEMAYLERTFVTQMPSSVTIDAGSDVVFDAYGFYSAAGGGNPDRIPTAWTVSISADGVNWTVVDEQVDRRGIVLGVYQLQGLYSVADRYPLLGSSAATDALGDASPVSIASGASLSIDSDYERFGTLFGAGTLKVNRGAVAEVNVCTNGTFSGAVTGVGTLAFCGTATQTFENASINVAKLELNGGTVAGTASRTGDLALAFNDGDWAGTLAVSGALTATGTPRFAVPAVTSGAVRRTLFTYGSIDADSAARLKSAQIIGELPKGIKAKVLVGETACILTASADGTIVIFR